MSAAFSRSGGVEITIPSTQAPAKPHMDHPTFKKFRRRVNESLIWLPHLGVEHKQTARALARIHRRVEDIAALKYAADTARGAAEASRMFYSLRANIGDAEVARAKRAAREAKRASKKDEGA